MLVTTAMVGESFRKLPSLSSASATRNSPCPSLALAAQAVELPADHHGGVEARLRPAPWRSGRWSWSCRGCRRWRCRISAASARPASRRAGSPGSCCSRAAMTSGLSLLTAEEITTTCGAATFSGRWPSVISAAQLAEPPVVISISLRSEPETLVAEVQQHLGDAAHADAADADEVDVFNLFEHILCRPSRSLPLPMTAWGMAPRGSLRENFSMTAASPVASRSF